MRTSNAPKFRRLAKYLRDHPELQKRTSSVGEYPRVCVLGALALANDVDLDLSDGPYTLLPYRATQQLWKANDHDGTSFDTFLEFIEAADDPTLESMLTSLGR
jgi:hypothetical protein